MWTSDMFRGLKCPSMAWKHNVKQRKELKLNILPGIRLQKDYKQFEGKTIDFIIKAIKSNWGE